MSAAGYIAGREVKGIMIRRRSTSRGGWNQACADTFTPRGSREAIPGLKTWTTSKRRPRNALARPAEAAIFEGRKAAVEATRPCSRGLGIQTMRSPKPSARSGRVLPSSANTVRSTPAESRARAVSTVPTASPLGSSA